MDEWWSKENRMEIRNLNQTLFLEAMASCTEITYVNGLLVGDPLDVKMFESSGWTLRDFSINEKTSSDQNIVLAYVQPKEYKPKNFTEIDNENEYVSAIIRRFEFSSKL